MHIPQFRDCIFAASAVATATTAVVVDDNHDFEATSGKDKLLQLVPRLFKY